MLTSIYEQLNNWMQTAVDYAWGTPLVVVLIGGGLFLTLYSGFRPLLRLGHALRVLTGAFDRDHDPGQITHFQALSTALAATIGVGNIGGVAVAITTGGAGAVFWMWVAAAVGMTTKFYSSSLAQLYRKEHPDGTVHGGPMYTIELGLGRAWKPLAIMFSVFGIVGCLPMFQTNQLASILDNQLGVQAIFTASCVTVLVAIVAFGGITRIGRLTARLVPSMCILYLSLGLALIVMRIHLLPGVIAQIFTEAFTGSAMGGGIVGTGVAHVIRTGVKRAAFSNEAGVGTAALAHGAAKTSEPIREGLVAMVGPFIDTIIVCTITACVILVAIGTVVIEGLPVNTIVQVDGEAVGVEWNDEKTEATFFVPSGRHSITCPSGDIKLVGTDDDIEAVENAQVVRAVFRPIPQTPMRNSTRRNADDRSDDVTQAPPPLKDVALTAAAFSSVLGEWAGYALVVIVALFAISTMLGYSFYGRQCFAYLFGANRSSVYTVIYLIGLFLGGVLQPDLVINTIDTAFAMMAVPNMIATVWLAPKVMKAANDYFRRLGDGEFHS
ncbi:MAG: alanine:cation symporter family protein [Planctomycetales bacterium]|nr:alanine:cation symporter family protein [Planctomycetales bacterium]